MDLVQVSCQLKRQFVELHILVSLNILVKVNRLLIFHEYLTQLICWHTINPLNKAVEIHILESATEHLLNKQVTVEETIIIDGDRDNLDVIIAHFQVLERSQNPFDAFICIMRIRDFARSNPQAVLVQSSDGVTVDNILDQSLVDVIGRMIVSLGSLRQEHSDLTHELSYKPNIWCVLKTSEAVTYL